MRSRASGSGEVDAYLSKVYRRLYQSWYPNPAFAGSKATARLVIYPDGTFTFRLLYPSDNRQFNESLIQYLDEIQQMRLPAHRKGKKLVVDIEFEDKG